MNGRFEGKADYYVKHEKGKRQAGDNIKHLGMPALKLFARGEDQVNQDQGEQSPGYYRSYTDVAVEIPPVKYDKRIVPKP